MASYEFELRWRIDVESDVEIPFYTSSIRRSFLSQRRLRVARSVWRCVPFGRRTHLVLTFGNTGNRFDKPFAIYPVWIRGCCKRCVCCKRRCYGQFLNVGLLQSRLKTIGGPRQNLTLGPLQANLISMPYIFFYVFPCESNFHVFNTIILEILILIYLLRYQTC